jgi:hypothetical protein
MERLRIRGRHLNSNRSVRSGDIGLPVALDTGDQQALSLHRARTTFASFLARLVA